MSGIEYRGWEGTSSCERAISGTGTWDIGRGEKKCRWLVDFGGDIFETMLRID